MSINDNDLFELLMTSDFNESYKPDEYIFFIMRFRQFYKLNVNKNKNVINDLEHQVKLLEEKVIMSERSKTSIIELKDELESKLLTPRKLTFKERITGKLNIEK